MGTWADLGSARLAWPDAPTSDVELEALLAVARDKCLAFAPELLDPDVPPDTWQRAQILTARDVWQAARRDGDFIGFDSYAVRVRPLGADAQAILRPYVGRPRVG